MFPPIDGGEHRTVATGRQSRRGKERAKMNKGLRLATRAGGLIIVIGDGASPSALACPAGVADHMLIAVVTPRIH
jgi:hypothetical protein